MYYSHVFRLYTFIDEPFDASARRNNPEIRIQYPRLLFPSILKRTIGSSDKERSFPFSEFCTS